MGQVKLPPTGSTLRRLSIPLIVVLGALAAFAPGAWATDIEVNTAADGTPADNGNCTLREAITAANSDTASGLMTGECEAGSGGDNIFFDNPPFTGVVGTSTISLGSALPVVTETLVINANTCPAALTTPCVGLHVTTGSTDALVSTTASSFQVEGLAITGAGTAVKGDDLAVRRSWFGIKLDQSVAKNQVGVDAGDNSVVGGNTAGERNVFAANNSGGLGEIGAAVVILGAVDVTVSGNYFGVNPSGALAAGMENGDNVRIADVGVDQASGNVIGGPDTGTPGVCDGACNLIGNAIAQGINMNGIGGLESPATGDNQIAGNFIGLGLNGTSLQANDGGAISFSTGNLEIGGQNTTDRNYVAGGDNTIISSFNPGAANLNIENNFVGLNAAGTASVPANPSSTQQDLNLADDGATILENRFGGAPVILSGDDMEFLGNVVGVGTGGQDVGINEGYAVVVAGDDAQIGGPDPGESNTIGFQTGDPWAAVGIEGDTDADNATIEGNFIGTNASGAYFPNEGAGIEIPIPPGSTSTGNVIGGDTAAEENVISNSGNDAIRIEGDGVDQNQILRNRGRNNGRLDVNGPRNDLFINLIGRIGEGNTANGPNAGIAAPGIGNRAATRTRITGRSGEPNGTEILVFTTFTRYADVRTYVAQGTVTNGAWSVTYPSAIAKGTCITASQTTLAKGTSELAPPVAVAGEGGRCDRIRPRTRITRVRRIVRGSGGVIKIRFKSNEKQAHFQCSRERGGFRKCRSPKSFRRLVFGACSRVRVRAVDAAGNKDRTPATARFCVPNP